MERIATQSDRFRAARDQLHWAAQIISAACDAGMERRADDSQSSLLPPRDGSSYWKTDAFPSGRRLAMVMGGSSICVLLGDERHFDVKHNLELRGRTLEEAMDWVGQALPDIAGKTLRVRDYDMPEHPFGAGAPFDASDEEMMLRVEDTFLSGAGQVHCYSYPSPRAETPALLWPHHFDIGKILLLREGADPAKDPCVGIGFSANDGVLDEAYFCANPYGIERPDALPALPHGRWMSEWFGAVLLSRESGGDPYQDRNLNLARMFSAVADFVVSVRPDVWR